MNTTTPIEESFVSFRGYNIWCRIVGGHEEPGKLPLLCLHGGPGASWDYFEPLEAMTGTGRRVIFYDQLGCGNSTVPTDPSIYTVALYLEEVNVIRRALGLERVHISRTGLPGLVDSHGRIYQCRLHYNKSFHSELPIDAGAKSGQLSKIRYGATRICRSSTHLMSKFCKEK